MQEFFHHSDVIIVDVIWCWEIKSSSYNCSKSLAQISAAIFNVPLWPFREEHILTNERDHIVHIEEASRNGVEVRCDQIRQTGNGGESCIDLIDERSDFASCQGVWQFDQEVLDLVDRTHEVWEISCHDCVGGSVSSVNFFLCGLGLCVAVSVSLCGVTLEPEEETSEERWQIVSVAWGNAVYL